MPVGDISTALTAPVDDSAAPGLTPSGYLQLYMAYAEAVSSGDADRAAAILRRFDTDRAGGARQDALSPFEEDVASVLRRLGHTVHTRVGDGGFRIDLAVLHPQPERGYLLGIDCDGPWHRDRSARIRDVWRADLLRRRGWRLHRLWSARWWSHRDDEIARLKKVVGGVG
jgi:very-short-patch-repair endonuclease